MNTLTLELEVIDSKYIVKNSSDGTFPGPTTKADIDTISGMPTIKQDSIGDAPTIKAS